MTKHRNARTEGRRLIRAIPLSTVAWACAFALTAAAPAALAASAEIVMLVGKGERRDNPRGAWQPAAVSQKLDQGEFVRTLANSQMAIYLPDRTQIRLNQNSELEVKSVAEAASWTESLLKLNFGRAWSQARPQTTAAGAPPTARSRVQIETVTATLGIRGTDWEVEVDREGRTHLVVLSGVVEMSNAFGTIGVGKGEAAVAEAGKAPVKLVLVNPKSRVQWVSSWRPQPRHWAGTDANRLPAVVSRIEGGDYNGAAAELRPQAQGDATAAILLADLLLHLGQAADARAVLSPHAQDPRAVVLTAYAMAQQDELPQAQVLLSSALSRASGNIELLLAQGDLAILDGDVNRARSAYSQVIAAQPANADAWYGIGVIESERENVRQARAALAEALRLRPGSAKASAELGATETFAGNLETGRKLLQDLLAREPDNYQALTALGLNKLKSGRPAEALEDFLKAGVIEPRYSRAWLYSGVAFYQQGERARALQAFQRASELDEHDPMPFLYTGIVEGDALEYGAAIESARQSQQRMPFLRSLNQAASNQKGSANLGSALANFGLEEWATYYATEAYSPYWGGSHLFLADRYTGKFNKNSELYTGFLTEPTAFGASNRNSSLVSTPGHYRSLEMYAERSNYSQLTGSAVFNGLSVEPIPISYFLSADFTPKLDSRLDDSTSHGRNFTLGLGAKPRYDIGLFAFVTNTRLENMVRSTQFPGDALPQSSTRADIGANIKLSAENQLWVKAGSGRDKDYQTGPHFSPFLADAIGALFGGTIPILPLGFLDPRSVEVTQRDFQLRHAFSAGAMQWTWGAERSRRDRTTILAERFAPALIQNDQGETVRVTDFYLSGLYRDGKLFDAQADLFRQVGKRHRSDQTTLTIDRLPSPPAVFPQPSNAADENYAEWNPRFGLKWKIGPLQSLRAVYQKWRRPGSAGTLSPVDTVGVPVNDWLPQAGGLYERARLQFDGEVSGSTFVQAFLDHERVNNGFDLRRTAIPDFDVTQLESLRNRPNVFSARADLEAPPQFGQGRVDTLGMAMNHMFNRTQTISARYLFRQAHQTGTNDGLAIPFMSRHFLSLGAQWALPQRWLLGATAIYRTERFTDDINVTRLAPGWAFGLTAYWESADKHSTVQLILDNLLSNKAAGTQSEPRLGARYAYKF